MTVLKGNFTFETVGGNTLIVSDGQVSPVKNRLEIKVTYDQEEEPVIGEIVFKFPAGKETADFAEFMNLKQIKFNADNWTVPELSREKFRELKNRKKEKRGGNARWYGCRYETAEEYVYALIPGEAWVMKDQLILDLVMENVVTTAAEGTADVKCTVDVLGEEPLEYQIEIIKEQDHSVEILDFYPDAGSASEGEQIRLNWFVQNADKLYLYSGTGKKEIDPSKSSETVTVPGTTEYVLEAVNGENTDSRKTVVQVLPLYLKLFAVDYGEEIIKWDVCCGKNLTVNGKLTSFASGSADLSEYSTGAPIILTAEGKNTSLESAVYYGTKEQRTDVVHFQKTITYYTGFQILDVSWELFELTRKNVAESIRIVFQDRERNQLYDIKGGESLGPKGSWQQILTGTDPERAGENILMTMYVKPFQDETANGYEITI